MSIKSEIERIKIGVQDIKTAIRRKNIPVPDSAKIDTLFSYIDQIPSGGSGKRVQTGTTTTVDINTGLSTIDTFIIYVEQLTGYGMMAGVCDSSGNGIVFSCTYFSQWGQKDCAIYNLVSVIQISGGTVRWSASYDQGFVQGATYKWIAIGSR